MKHILSMVCLSLLIIWAGIVSATQRSARRQTDAFLTNPSENTSDNTILTDRQKKQITMRLALKRGDIVQAIKESPQDTATDRYNLGTLKIFWAYQAIVANQKEAYIQRITEANHDLAQAIQQTTNNTIKNRSSHNQKILTELQKIATMKTCLSNLTTLLWTVDSIQETIKDIEAIIEQQNTTNNITTIDQECRNTLQTDGTRTYDSIKDIEQTLAENKEAYIKINHTYKDNPVLCFNTDFTEQLQSITNIQNTVQETKQTYIQRQTAQTNNGTTTLRLLCKKNQEDDLSHQPQEKNRQSDIKNITDMAKQIENKQQTTNQEWWQTTQNTIWSSDTSTYIPLTEEESILWDIDKASNQWIETMMHIKNTWYDPTQTLKNLFQEFYGDTQEFSIPNW